MMELDTQRRTNPQSFTTEKPKDIKLAPQTVSLRLKVIDVLEQDRSQQVLELTACKEDSKDGDKIMMKLRLEGIWSRGNIISKKSILHLLNPIYDQQNQVYTVNNSQGFVIVEPDNLLTCTYVASSLFCERKTWLNHVFLGQVGTNRAMLVGTLVHEVFQHGVRNKIADKDKLIKFLDDLLDDATVMLEIYSVELHLNDIRTEAVNYLSSVVEFIEKYMLSGPKQPLANSQDLEIKILNIQDIEENVWSTKYGLKGKIDVTSLVRIHNNKTKTLLDRTIPLELKTGNPNLSSSHAAQVSLYSMMIEDRYAETNQGFVIYLKDKASIHSVQLNHNIKRDLIQRRNTINYNMKNYFIGPEMIDQKRMCENCDRLTECVLMSKIYEPGRLEDYPAMKSLSSDATGHLDKKFIDFFQKYHEKLVFSMTNHSEKVNSTGSFWTYSSDEAEANGTGMGKLQAILPKDDQSPFITFKRHCDYKFTKPLDVITIDDDEDDGKSDASNGSQKSSTSPSQKLNPVKKQKIFDYFKPIQTKTIAPLSSSMSNNHSQSPKKLKPFKTNLDFSRCRVAISIDNVCEKKSGSEHLDSQNSSTAIAIGFVNELKEDYFTMKLYEGSLDPLKPDLMYRVDKIEKKNQVDIERLVLVRLLMREDYRSQRIRQLILDETFVPTRNVKLNHFILTSGFEEISELDSDLQKFVVEAASTDNYYILHENLLDKSPKSKINKSVAVLARIFNTLDRNMLIVAQNVDNLVDLMKLLQLKKIKFILIDDGKSAKARHQFAANLVKVPQASGLDLTKKFDSYIRQHELATIVITSYAMSVGGLLFTRKTFDYCVAYDCDKTELLTSLSPMFCSDKYIIVDVIEDSVVDEKTKDMALGKHLRNLRSYSVG